MGFLNLLVLRAKQPERLAEFYSHFGLEFVLEKHGSGPVHHACSAGGSVFEIYPCQNDLESTVSTRIGFTVPNVDDVISACAAKVISAPKNTSWGRRAVIVDPEGHKVELLQKA